MSELEDILKHHGVKGMKWGVIRSKASKAGSSIKSGTKKTLKKVGDSYTKGVQKRAARSDKRAEAYHEKYKDSWMYKAHYNSNLRAHAYNGKSKERQHLDAVKRTRTDMQMIQAATLSYVMTPAKTSSSGRSTVNNFSNQRPNQSNTERGRKIVDGRRTDE